MFGQINADTRRRRRSTTSAAHARPAAISPHGYTSGRAGRVNGRATPGRNGGPFSARPLLLGVVGLLLFLAGAGAVLMVSGNLAQLVAQVLPHDRIVDIQMDPRSYTESGREVRVRGVVREAGDIPFSAMRALLLDDGTGRIWVRTARCRKADLGDRVVVRASVFPGFDVPVLGPTGVALIEKAPPC